MSLSHTPLTDMVRDMLSRCLPSDTIVAALQAAEQAIVASQQLHTQNDTAAERRRAWDRERHRKRKLVASETFHPNSTRIPVESNGCNFPPEFHRNPPEFHPTDEILPSSLSSLLLREERKEEKKGGLGENKNTKQNSQAETVIKLKRIGRCLPEDWAPSEKHYAAGQQIGMSRDVVDRSAEDMRLWAKANQNRQVARKADWNATFLGWIRREARVSPKPPAKRYFRV